MAAEWSCHDLCEKWDPCLKEAEPAYVVKCSQKVSVEKRKEVNTLGRREWILLAAYRKQHQQREQVCKEKIDLENQVCELQGKIVTLQCQNRLLMDKLDTYQTVAEKEVVWVAQNKY